MENFTAAVPVPASRAGPADAGPGLHTVSGAPDSLAASDPQASVQNGGKGWPPQWHLPVTERRSIHHVLFNSPGETTPLGPVFSKAHEFQKRTRTTPRASSS